LCQRAQHVDYATTVSKEATIPRGTPGFRITVFARMLEFLEGMVGNVSTLLAWRASSSVKIVREALCKLLMRDTPVSKNIRSLQRGSRIGVNSQEISARPRNA